MAETRDPDGAPLPGTVFTPRQVRMLKIAVIVMGVLLVGGFAFVLAAIVYQASRLGQTGPVDSEATPPGDVVPQTTVAIPSGASIAALSLDGSRLAVQLKGQDGSEIVIVDIASGKVVSRIKLKPQ